MPRKIREIKIISLDTETCGLEGIIKRIAVYDGKDVTYGYVFADVEPVLENYYNAGYAVHIYIHNLDFDARKIPEIFDEKKIDWNNTVLIDNRYVKITGKHYTFHDSFHLLPESLKNLTGKKGFNLSHEKMDLMEAVHQAYPNEYVDELDYFVRCDPDDPVYLEYLGMDVISLYDLIYKLIDVSGIAERELVKRLTTASMSKYIFRHGYKGVEWHTEGQVDKDYDIATIMTSWSSTRHVNMNFSAEKYIRYIDIENRMREAYVGGRCEVFIPHLKPRTYRGKRKIIGYHYDVNSLYPSQMIDHEFPVGFPTFYGSDILLGGDIMLRQKWTDWLKYHKGLGFLKCVVYIPPQDIPPLPVKIGKLIFPCGVVEGTWTYTELEYAIAYCGVEILEYQEMIHFDRTFKVFHNIVETFYNMKKQAKEEGNAALVKFSKLILNTLYGWFALRRDDKTELHDMGKFEKYVEKAVYLNEELGYMECESTIVTESIQVQIAAYVSSYARLILLDAMRHMSEIGQVYYCDTDSIICDVPMPEEMVDKYALGKWDLEKKLTEGYFLQPKVYYEEYVEDDEKKENVKFKGVSVSTQKTMTVKMYERLYKLLCKGEKGQETVEVGKEVLRSLRYTQKEKIDWNTVEKRDKKINLAAKQKRDMDYKGNKSYAWYFQSLDEFYKFNFSGIPSYEEDGNLIDPCS